MSFSPPNSGTLTQYGTLFLSLVQTKDKVPSPPPEYPLMVLFVTGYGTEAEEEEERRKAEEAGNGEEERQITPMIDKKQRLACIGF